MYFRMLAEAGCCCALCVVDCVDLFFSPVVGEKNAWESGWMNQGGHAGTAGEPMLLDVCSYWKNLSLFHAVGVKYRYSVLIHSQYPCFYTA